MSPALCWPSASMNTSISPRGRAGPALDGRAVAHRIGGGQHARPVLGGDGGRVVGGPVVHDDDFGFRIGGPQAGQGLPQPVGFVLGRKDDRDTHGRSADPYRLTGPPTTGIATAIRCVTWGLRYLRTQVLGERHGDRCYRQSGGHHRHCPATGPGRRAGRGPRPRGDGPGHPRAQAARAVHGRKEAGHLRPAGRGQLGRVRHAASSTCAALDPNQSAIKLVSEELVRKHQVLPLFKRGNRLFVGIADPTNTHALDEIKFHTNLTVEPILVDEDKIRRTHRPVARDRRRARRRRWTTSEGLENLETTGGDDDLANDIGRRRQGRRHAGREVHQQGAGRRDPPRRLGHPLRALRNRIPRAPAHRRPPQAGRQGAGEAARRASPRA